VSKLRGERDALRGEGEAARRERDAAVAEKESLHERMKVLDSDAQSLRASLASERNTIAAERDTLSREWGALKGKLGIDAAGGDQVGDANVQKAVLENVLDELNSTFKQARSCPLLLTHCRARHSFSFACPQTPDSIRGFLSLAHVSIH
jgi:chromosome segregation ATPase